jgi:hypothetical protein
MLVSVARPAGPRCRESECETVDTHCAKHDSGDAVCRRSVTKTVQAAAADQSRVAAMLSGISDFTRSGCSQRMGTNVITMQAAMMTMPSQRGSGIAKR